MNKKTSRRITYIILLVTAITLVAIYIFTPSKTSNSTNFFVQISDPQLGLITESEDFTPERENMERIAAAVNKLQPDFIVFSGDYVQHRTDANALEGFRQMCELFSEEIPLYFVPGNHDVEEATPEDIEQFVARYGHDRFVHNGENYTTIGFNSCVIKTAAKGESAEYEWMEESLKKASERNLPIILIAHHPLFVDTPEEEESGVNLPVELRHKYLQLMKKYEVDLLLSGHLHTCVRAEYEGIQLATSGAAGCPLGDDPSGITIVTIPTEGSDTKPIATYYSIDTIPRVID